MDKRFLNIYINIVHVIMLTAAVSMLSGCVGGGMDRLRADMAMSRAEGMYQRGDYAGAGPQYRSAAEAGSPRGQYMLGRMYASGQGLPVDQAEAVRWIRMAADSGYPAADFEMGIRHLTGDGVTADPGQTVYYFQRAAGNGHELSMYNLGFVHALGVGVPQNSSEALRWFRMAGDAGFPVEEGLLTRAGIESYAASQVRARPESGPAPREARLLDVSSNQDASTIQSRLAELGFYDMAVDGIWGPGSSEALRNFQKSGGLEPSGAWDMHTQRLLFPGY
jgi:hypothetical protein